MVTCWMDGWTENGTQEALVSEKWIQPLSSPPQPVFCIASTSLEQRVCFLGMMPSLDAGGVSHWDILGTACLHWGRELLGCHRSSCRPA